MNQPTMQIPHLDVKLHLCIIKLNYITLLSDFLTITRMNIAPHMATQRRETALGLEKFYVVVPALNEGDRIAGVIKKLQHLGFKNIVVVNDGSTDHTSQSIPKSPGIFELRHLINLGPGASTMTGIKFALSQDADFIATIDADHQSDPIDLVQMVTTIKNEQDIDLLIGSRFLQRNPIPTSRRVFNYIGNVISFLITGLYVTDSQSGYKVMSRRFAEKLNIDYNGFEFCIDIIKKAHMNQFKVAEIPVSVVYTKETMAKGQSFKQGVMMLGRLFNPFS